MMIVFPFISIIVTHYYLNVYNYSDLTCRGVQTGSVLPPAQSQDSSGSKTLGG